MAPSPAFHVLGLSSSLAIALLVHFPGAAVAADKPKSGTGTAAIVNGSVGKQLDEYLSAIEKSAGGFCGSALVAVKGKVLLQKSYGLADADKKTPIVTNALWDWASVTKQFTAAAVLVLEQEKKLSLDDSITKFFPDAPPDKQSVTLRHLLNHTSGIQTGFDEKQVPDVLDRDATIGAWLELPMLSKPGEKWAYSNVAYGALAAVIERASGESYEEFCVKRLFRPAGMKDACFIGDPKLELDRVPRDARGAGVHFAYGYKMTWGYRGAGGAIASTAEMFLWDRALRANKILSEKSRAAYYKVALENYACGWYVHVKNGDTHLTHSGSVGTTVTYYLRALKADVVIALALSYQPTEHPELIAYKLFNIAL